MKKITLSLSNIRFSALSLLMEIVFGQLLVTGKVVLGIEMK